MTESGKTAESEGETEANQRESEERQAPYTPSLYPAPYTPPCILPLYTSLYSFPVHSSWYTPLLYTSLSGMLYVAHAEHCVSE